LKCLFVCLMKMGIEVYGTRGNYILRKGKDVSVVPRYIAITAAGILSCASSYWRSRSNPETIPGPTSQPNIKDNFSVGAGFDFLTCCNLITVIPGSSGRS
jgi:hypothetical protein